MTKNQRLFGKIVSFNKKLIYNKSLLSQSDWVGFQPWVLKYLLDQVLDKSPSVYFSKEKKRIEEDLIKKPKIFSLYKKHNLNQISNPVVSIITPSFNHGCFLEDTLNSVANQTYKNYEHIIIDGGSTDNTVKILRSTKYLKWISKPDSGYNEAFGKGLAMARGKYIMNCAVSDGYANTNWFKKCVKILDSHKDISMVWGFPQNISEEGIPGKISYPYFHLNLAPMKENFFYYWLRTGHGYPEGNVCVRKEVMKKCITSTDRLAKDCDIWKEFNYNFNALGYFSYHIPVVANYGRAHKGQSGQNDMRTGVGPRLYKIYRNKINIYRLCLLLGIKKHKFRDSKDNILRQKFIARRFLSELLIDFIKRVKFQIDRFI